MTMQVLRVGRLVIGSALTGANNVIHDFWLFTLKRSR
jgi:hypothetical protein